MSVKKRWYEKIKKQNGENTPVLRSMYEGLQNSYNIQCIKSYDLSIENEYLKKDIKKLTDLLTKMKEENAKLKEKVRLNDEFLQQINSDRF